MMIQSFRPPPVIDSSLPMEQFCDDAIEERLRVNELQQGWHRVWICMNQSLAEFEGIVNRLAPVALGDRHFVDLLKKDPSFQATLRQEITQTGVHVWQWLKASAGFQQILLNYPWISRVLSGWEGCGEPFVAEVLRPHFDPIQLRYRITLLLDRVLSAADRQLVAVDRAYFQGQKSLKTNDLDDKITAKGSYRYLEGAWAGRLLHIFRLHIGPFSLSKGYDILCMAILKHDPLREKVDQWFCDYFEELSWKMVSAAQGRTQEGGDGQELLEILYNLPQVSQDQLDRLEGELQETIKRITFSLVRAGLLVEQFFPTLSERAHSAPEGSWSQTIWTWLHDLARLPYLGWVFERFYTFSVMIRTTLAKQLAPALAHEFTTQLFQLIEARALEYLIVDLLQRLCEAEPGSDHAPLDEITERLYKGLVVTYPRPS